MALLYVAEINLACRAIEASEWERLWRPPPGIPAQLGDPHLQVLLLNGEIAVGQLVAVQRYPPTASGPLHRRDRVTELTLRRCDFSEGKCALTLSSKDVQPATLTCKPCQWVCALRAVEFQLSQQVVKIPVGEDRMRLDELVRVAGESDTGGDGQESGMSCACADMQLDAELLSASTSVNEPEASLAVSGLGDPPTEGQLTTDGGDSAELCIDPEAEELCIDPEAEDLCIDPETEDLCVDPEAEELCIDPEAEEFCIDPEAEDPMGQLATVGGESAELCIQSSAAPEDLSTCASSDCECNSFEILSAVSGSHQGSTESSDLASRSTRSARKQRHPKQQQPHPAPPPDEETDLEWRLKCWRERQQQRIRRTSRETPKQLKDMMHLDAKCTVFASWVLAGRQPLATKVPAKTPASEAQAWRPMLPSWRPSDRDQVWSVAQTAVGSEILCETLDRGNERDHESILDGLRGHVVDALASPHASSVIAKAVETLRPVKLRFVVEELSGPTAPPLSGPENRRVVKRLRECCPGSWVAHLPSQAW
jgi:hypothetical protein